MNKKYLKSLYLATVRVLRKNPNITLKKDDEPLFDDLAKLLDAKNIEYYDYIHYQFNNPTKFFPGVKYICSVKAVQMYGIHQKMKNRYVTEDYATDGKDFYVNRTYKKYPLSQVEGPTHQDPNSNFALTIIESDNYNVTQDLIEDAEYTLCKFKYKEKTPPDKLVEFVKKYRKTI